MGVLFLARVFVFAVVIQARHFVVAQAPCVRAVDCLLATIPHVSWIDRLVCTMVKI